MEDRQPVDVVFHLLAGVVSLVKLLHSHPHVEVLAFHVPGRSVILMEIADHATRFCTRTMRGAVMLMPFRVVGVELDQLCETDIFK